MPTLPLYETSPNFLTPAEHADLIADAGRALLELTLNPDIQRHFAASRDSNPYSLHATYPGEADERSDMVNQWALAAQKYNFVAKDGDPLGGDYDKHLKLNIIVLDNTQPNIVPACVITPHLPTPDPEKPGYVKQTQALKAVGSAPWFKDLAATIAATKDRDGQPLPDISSQETLLHTMDVSLVSIMPSYRLRGGEYSNGKNFLNWLYNATLRAAAAQGITRMVAALDEPILRGLRAYRKHWHALEGIDLLPYATRVPDSNKSTVATVDLVAWQKDMAENWPKAEHKLWGKYLEEQGVQVVGLKDSTYL